MSKKSFSKRQNKDTTPSVPVVEETADKLANKDNDGVVVINMAPRNHRDRYAKLREDSAEENTEKTVVLDNTNLYISAEEASATTIDTTQYKSIDIESKIDELDGDIKDVKLQYDATYASYEVLNDKYKKLEDRVEECATLNDLSYYLTDVKKKIDIVDNAQANGISGLSHDIISEAYERKESDDLLMKSVESLSENLRSVSEGFDCYKSTHELEHTEINSKFSSLQGSVDKIDDYIIRGVDDDRRSINRVREASKDCIDSLIRVTRMLEITFISIVLAFIFLMVKTSIPTSATVVRVVFGVMSDLCMVFIAMESRYVFKYIGFAAKSINKLKDE